jgi:hypothetical protein
MTDFLQDPRFAGLSPLSSKLWLSSPAMHGEEQHWIATEMVGRGCAVGLSAGTATLHLMAL